MPRRIDQIKEKIFSGALRREEADYFGAGSILDGLSTDVARLVYEVEANQEAILSAVHLDSASEDQIERYARDFNVMRRPAVRAFTLESDKNIVISTTTGESVGAVLAQNNIILSGLRITNGDKTKVFVIEGTTALINTESSIYCTARCINIGGTFNVAKGELSRFEKQYQKLTVTNNFSILNGQDTESMTVLKARISQKIDSNVTNKNALAFLLNSISGYGKSTVIQNYDGAGTILICLQPSSGVSFANSSLVSIRNSILTFLPAGQNVLVKNYDPITFNIKTRIIPKEGVSGASLVNPVKASIVSYFNSLQGGDTVSLSSLQSQLIGNIGGLKYISSKGDAFEEVKYTINEGSSSFEFIADPNSNIRIEQTQIATLASVEITYE